MKLIGTCVTIAMAATNPTIGVDPVKALEWAANYIRRNGQCYYTGDMVPVCSARPRAASARRGALLESQDWLGIGA